MRTQSLISSKITKTKITPPFCFQGLMTAPTQEYSSTAACPCPLPGSCALNLLSFLTLSISDTQWLTYRLLAVPSGPRLAHSHLWPSPPSPPPGMVSVPGMMHVARNIPTTGSHWLQSGVSLTGSRPEHGGRGEGFSSCSLHWAEWGSGDN